MTRLVQQHPTLAARFLSRLVLAVLAVLLATSTGDAALTTGFCLAKKQTAWGTLLKCQATERAKVLKGKMADLTKCQTTFQTALTKISAKATKAAIGCRYRDNADSTITDYDTGLMWEKKTAGNVNDTFTWTAALKDFPEGYNQCASSDGSTLGCGSLYHDWRLPNIVELQTIVDATQGACGGGSGACIDPIFGTTVADFYWSATTATASTSVAWHVGFSNQVVDFTAKSNANYVRAVRGGL